MVASQVTPAIIPPFEVSTVALDVAAAVRADAIPGQLNRISLSIFLILKFPI
jgi:hypothetical protein